MEVKRIENKKIEINSFSPLFYGKKKFKWHLLIYTCEGIGKTCIFWLWDNTAIYKIIPKGQPFPGFFTRPGGPGVYLLVCSADGIRAAC